MIGSAFTSALTERDRNIGLQSLISDELEIERRAHTSRYSSIELLRRPHEADASAQMGSREECAKQ